MRTHYFSGLCTVFALLATQALADAHSPSPAPSIASPTLAAATPDVASPPAPRDQAQTPPSQPQGTVPSGCPLDQQFGGWVIRQGATGAPVVTTRASKGYSGTATRWTTEGLSLELLPLKNGSWSYLLVARNLKHGGEPVKEIKGQFGASIWDGATEKEIKGFSRKDGGGILYDAPYTIIGLPLWMIDEAVDKIEATAQVNFALSLPKEDGSALIDVAWLSPLESKGLRAAMTAAKVCAVF